MADAYHIVIAFAIAVFILTFFTALIFIFLQIITSIGYQSHRNC